MSNLLVVFGATGQQGGALVNYVLNDPQLSKQYHIRAISRDPSKSAAKALQQKGVEVVSADVSDTSSLAPALKGAHTVFIMTISDFQKGTKAREIAQGKAVADAAVSAKAKYIIFSTLANAGEVSGGKITTVQHFDAKAEIETYIRGLPVKSAFFAPGGFMQNFSTMEAPQPVGNGTYMMANIMTPESVVPLIDIHETGHWVGAILAEPDKYAGKVFAAAEGLYSKQQIAEIISQKSGKTVKYQQIPVDVFKGFLPPMLGDDISSMWQYIEDFGYYGPDSKEKIAWTKAQVRGKVSTFGEYLEKNPLKLA